MTPVTVTLPDGAPALRLAANTTLRSPEADVPAGAQSLVVRARSGSGAALAVLAEPVAGGPAIPLGIVDADAAGTPRAVPVAAVAGTRVRFVLDPSAPLGGVVDVGGAGPFAAPLPGWVLRRGAVLREAGPPAGLVVHGDPAVFASPVAAPPAGTRALLVRISGTGSVRLAAGGRAAAATARAAGVDVTVPVAAGRPVRLTLTADPGGGTLRIRDLGRYVVAVRVSGLRVRRTATAVTVRGTLGAAGARLPVRLLGARGGGTAARAAADGRFTLHGRTRPGARPVLVVSGDRTRLGRRLALR